MHCVAQYLIITLSHLTVNNVRQRQTTPLPHALTLWLQDKCVHLAIVQAVVCGTITGSQASPTTVIMEGELFSIVFLLFVITLFSSFV